MENISLEQIDLIMQRANVSYSEAKEALENSNGDIVEALLYLEKADKIKATPCSKGEGFKSFIAKLNATQFILRKKERVYVDTPLSIAILALILCFPFTLILLAIALIYGIRIDIKGENDIAQKVNATFDSFSK